MENSNSENYANLLIRHILGGNAFIKIEEILESIQYQQVGIIPDGLLYSFWQIFEHMRIAQKDILEFSQGSLYKALNWPDDYWPDNAAPYSEDQWNKTKQDFFIDRDRFNEIVLDNSDNLLSPFKFGDGQSLFREALLILEHNAYHTGQLMILSRLLSMT